MAGGNKEDSLANLFELQRKEKLLEINLRNSGGTMYKGKESGALSVLNKLRLEGEAGFCDVTLEVEGRQLTTHRCILAANSQFFYTMFSSGMKDSREQVLSLPSICFTSMSLILDYFYTREIVINDKNVLDLLNASSFLLVTPVKNACAEHLAKGLNTDNCFSVLQVAEQFDAGELVEKANNFIKTNFFIVVNNEKFVSISQKQLVYFISSGRIEVEKEEEVYQAVLKWVKHDEANRVAVLPELLKHLRSDSLPEGFLESEMEKEPLLHVIGSDGDAVLKKGERPTTEIRDVLIGIGTQGNRLVFLYDLDVKQMPILTCLYKLECLQDVAVVGRTMFFVGGKNLSSLSAICFDDLKKPRPSGREGWQLNFESKAPFSEERSGTSLVNLNGLLYYIGGWQGESQSGSCCNIVECYNPELDEWNFCAGLNTPRGWFGCVASEENIYVIGGTTKFESGSLLSSVEKYDPESNSWSYVAPLKEARASAGCVFLNGKIFVIGGCDEVYCPVTDDWQSIAELPYDYGILESNAIVIGNKITVPVDPDEKDLNFEALEYDMQSNEWLEVKTLGPRGKRGSFTFCTIKLPLFHLLKMSREIFKTEWPEDWSDIFDD